MHAHYAGLRFLRHLLVHAAGNSQLLLQIPTGRRHPPRVRGRARFLPAAARLGVSHATAANRVCSLRKRVNGLPKAPSCRKARRRCVRVFKQRRRRATYRRPGRPGAVLLAALRLKCTGESRPICIAGRQRRTTQGAPLRTHLWRHLCLVHNRECRPRV